MALGAAAPPSTTAGVWRCLENIRRHDGLLKAMITVLEEDALREAAALDEAASGGDTRGLLHGMPVTLKDVIDTAGVRTTSGSKFFEHHVPAVDAEVVRRLKANGAVIIGKVNLHEFAYGGTTQNPFYGRCRNPWNPDCIPGGSSGGSGAAAAAEMCIASLGTDTGGSGRIPGALNGIAALRPTVGRISNRGVTPVSQPFDTLSPMAYRVTDVARVFAAIAGYDPSDPISVDRSVENFLPGLGEGIGGVRIGLPRAFFFEEVEADVLAPARAAIDVLERLGAQVVAIDVPGAAEAKDQFEKIFHTDCADFHRQRFATEREKFGKDTAERLAMGTERKGIDYAAGMRWMEAWRRRLALVFGEVDIVASPATPVAAPPIAESEQTTAVTRRLTRFCYPWSIAGTPVLVVPCGFNRAGLPVGLSLAAAWWQEPLLFRVGVAYQAATDWHTRRPPLLGAA
ncbi:MAG: amidase [Alphaproteobacteria bacterium]|nr:amidase [Alphaproteobacteria bacterium]